MLIRNLYNLFCGSESQDGRSVCAPDVIEEKEHIVIIPEKFKDDIQRLISYCRVELKSGLCIEIELSELLEILPRERRRLLFEEHVFTGVSGTNVIRLLPPLTLSLEEAAEFIKRFKKVLSK